MRPIRALHSAVAMYTRLPVRKHDWEDRDFPDGLVAFPWLGAALGAVVGLFGWGVAWVAEARWLGVVLALGSAAWITGAMHLDGVADVADGLGSRKPPEHARAIMKQSDIGPMGVTTLLLVLLAEAAAIAVLPPQTWPLLLAAGLAAGRVSALAGALPRLGEEPVSGTLSGLVAGRVRPAHVWMTRVLVVLAVVAGSWWLLGWRAAACWAGAIVMAWLLAAGWQRHLLRRLGRLNGDCYGSLIETTQVITWVLIALTYHRMGVA